MEDLAHMYISQIVYLDIRDQSYFSHFSVVFILLSILMGLLLLFGYSKAESLFGSEGDTLTLRAFINALAFDLALVVISPLMLLYSSKDLRKSIKSKFEKWPQIGQRLVKH